MKQDPRRVSVQKCFDLGLIDRRLFNKLTDYGYATLGDLSEATVADLEKIPSLGNRSRTLIVDILSQHGLATREQSPESLVESERQRRSRLAGVRFAVVSGVEENGDPIKDLLLVHMPDGRFKSPGVEEEKEWKRRYADDKMNR